MNSKQKDYFIKRIKNLTQEAIDKKNAETFLTPKREAEFKAKIIPVDENVLLEILRKEMETSLFLNNHSYRSFSVSQDDCYKNLCDVLNEVEKETEKFYVRKNEWISHMRAECNSLCDSVMFTPDAESLFEKITAFEKKLLMVKQDA